MNEWKNYLLQCGLAMVVNGKVKPNIALSAFEDALSAVLVGKERAPGPRDREYGLGLLEAHNAFACEFRGDSEMALESFKRAAQHFNNEIEGLLMSGLAEWLKFRDVRDPMFRRALKLASNGEVNELIKELNEIVKKSIPSDHPALTAASAVLLCLEEQSNG
jgi:hypothetical protein